MHTLIDFIEQYLKREGLSGKIADTRKQGVLQPPPIIILLLWFGGTWLFPNILQIIYFKNNKIIYTIFSPVIVFILFSLMIVIYYVIKNFKSKSQLDLPASKIGSLYLTYYPIILIIVFCLINWNLIATFILIGAYISLLGILLIANSTFVFQRIFEIITVYFNVFTKSLSILISIIPILLVVILLSLFSQDFWLILGNITWNRLCVVMMIFIMPVIILNYINLNSEAKKIIGDFPSLGQIPEIFTNVEYFQNKFQKQLISSREWEMIINDILWRNVKKIDDENKPLLFKNISSRLIVFTEITFLLLLFTFFIYFMIVFYTLLTPGVITNWTGIHIFSVPFDIRPLNIPIKLPSYLIPQIKVSIVLSVIVAITARVSTITNNEFRANVLSWLERKARNWLATLVIYDCALMSNFQLWRFRVKKGKVVNIDILVKPGLEFSRIEAACRLAASIYSKKMNITIVTAFEAVTASTNYDYGLSGKLWRLLINPTTHVDEFNDQSLDFSGIPSVNDNLGFEQLDQNKIIPDEWFGNGKIASELGRVLWDNDLGHKIVLHPYVTSAPHSVICEIALMRKLETSSQYKALVKTFLNILLTAMSEYESVLLTLYFRSTTEIVASLDYSVGSKLVVYKDQFLKKYLHSKLESWILKQKV